jgi:hypothetical protein
VRRTRVGAAGTRAIPLSTSSRITSSTLFLLARTAMVAQAGIAAGHREIGKIYPFAFPCRGGEFHHW